MNKCKNCGYTVSDGVLFCKKCGTPIESDKDSNMNETVVVEELTKYSLEMRELSDRMISTYVKAVKQIELELETTKTEAEKKVQEMERKIREHEGEIKRYKAYVSELEEKLKKADEYANQLLSEKTILENEKKELFVGVVKSEEVPVTEKIDDADERPDFCPNCGEAVEDDMVFCGNCGTKLV